MKISFECPMCHKVLEGESEWNGKKAQCPYCQQKFVVPESMTDDDTKTIVHPQPISKKHSLKWLYITLAAVFILSVVLLVNAHSSKSKYTDKKKSEKSAHSSEYKNATVKEIHAAAEKGDAVSQYNLGLCYANGEGVEKDFKKAAYWWSKAAEQGLKEAQFNLGVCYVRGEGVPEDLEKAAYWWQKAAEQGVAEAQFLLGLGCHSGLGVQINLKLAVYWFRKAAEQGHAEAQFHLGECYAKGDGVQKDLKQAIYWLQKAAEQDYVHAQFILGMFYANGHGVEKDLKQAIYWLQKAAKQGLAAAQFELGWCYGCNASNKEDLKNMAYWYRKAAEQGFGRAQVLLGVCYCGGLGVERNLNQGIKLFRKVAKQGDEDAKKLLKEILNARPWWIKAVVYGGSQSASQFCKTAERMINEDLSKKDHPFRKYVESAHVTVTVTKAYVSDFSLKTKDGSQNIGDCGENIRSIVLSVTTRWDGEIHKSGRTVLKVILENVNGNIEVTDAKIVYSDALVNVNDPEFWIKAGVLLFNVVDSLSNN